MAIFGIPYRESLLEVQVRERPGGAAVLVVTGEIDVDSAPLMQQAVDDLLGQGAVGRVVLDLAGVTFCGAAGVRALLTCIVAAERLGVDVEIRRARGHVRRVLTICSIVDGSDLSGS